MGKTNKKNSFLTWAESTDRKIYRETDDYVKALRGLYDEAIDAMHGKIYKYLVQIAAEDGTSLAEAKRWLNGEERRSFQRSLEEFRRKSIDAIGNAANESAGADQLLASHGVEFEDGDGEADERGRKAAV